MTTLLQQIGASDYATMMRDEKVESMSGPGSSLANTLNVRAWLPNIIGRHGIKSMADIPCGDHHWMSHVDLGECVYFGADAIATVLAAAKLKRPDRYFGYANAISNVPRQYDLIFCRDLLVHLPLEYGIKVVNNFKASGSKYLAVTDFPNVADNPELPESHPGWGWRKLSMRLSPFNLGEPIDFVYENEGDKKCMVLFKL